MKKFKNIFTLLPLLLMFIIGCSDNPVSVNEAALDSDFQIKYGETVNLRGENLSITFDDVIEDSRCPEGMRCFWQGTAKIKLFIKYGREYKIDTVQTYLPQKIISIGGINNSYVFTVKKAEPYPKQNENINKDEYILTLNVSHFTYGFNNSEIENKRGIYGQVYISPTSPVEREGYISYKPFQAQFYVVDGNNDSILIKIDSTGRFIKYLQEGKYNIVSGKGFPYLSEPGISTTVGGKMNYINIFYNSGIR